MEKIVDRTVDWSSDMVVTDPEDRLADPLVLELGLPVEEGDTVAVCPSESVVVNSSSDRVNVSTSPSESVPRKSALKSTEELESAELVVTEAKSIVKSEVNTELPLVKVDA